MGVLRSPLCCLERTKTGGCVVEARRVVVQCRERGPCFEGRSCCYRPLITSSRRDGTATRKVAINRSVDGSAHHVVYEAASLGLHVIRDIIMCEYGGERCRLTTKSEWITTG